MCSILLSLSFLGCSVRKLAVNSIANALSSEESLVFTGEDDPELVGDALPFALKLYESLFEMAPDNSALAIATGKAFSMYAFAFVQTPAERLGDSELDKKKRQMLRAKKLFLRGRKYAFTALDLSYPGFSNQITTGSVDSALQRVNLADTTMLYWAGISWMGAIMADKFDFIMLLGMKRAIKLIEKVASLNDGFGQGSIHDFYISYYGGLPESMGGSEEKARYHFKKAVELSGGKLAGPYLSLATSVSVNKQDADEFTQLCKKALSVDVRERNANRLVNILSRRKAQWLLDHIDEYFLLDEPEPEETEPESESESPINQETESVPDTTQSE